MNSFRYRKADATGLDDPAPDIARGLFVVIAFFVVLLGWAALARVDAAVYAHGTIVVSGSRQEVQHREGGVVSALHVKEGDHVVKGQVLVDLAGDQTEATANALIAQFIDLKLKEARLQAEQAGGSGFAVPEAVNDFGPQYQPLVDSATRLQRNTLAANRTYMATQLSVLDQRVEQTREGIAGYEEQSKSNIQRQSLTKDELSGVKDLQAKGYAPMTRVRALQEEIAGLEGEYGALRANIAASEAKIGETRMQAVSVRKQFLDQTIADLSDTQSKLKAMEPQMQAARTSFDRLHIKATATGKIMGLSVTTVGGVIAAGQKVADIVPDATPLVIQAMVDIKDGNDIKPGQLAQVRFTSLHERDVPILNGRVLDVSGDSFSDKETNKAFYTARIQISPETMKTLNRIMKDSDSLKPGLPVEVVVPLRKRTMLQYLLEPLNQSLWKTFRES
ncbi:MAG: HlyD family type I secretion periplasmic adaptor subunit [Asticcacaulis sp.]|nr:HlyD family type I secretion periplasmic adaptor subunit [Asticcacaulis sp.]